ncbi:MAG TPA: PIN domain-containing protein [Azospirillum sp.]
MTLRVALDSNVILYALDINDPLRRDRATGVMIALPLGAVVLPAQVLGEVLSVLIGRKARWERGRARDTIGRLRILYDVRETTAAAMMAAADLVAEHQLQVWDAVILAVAAEAGCGLLLSEDMNHGFQWGGVTVVNPFRDDTHPLLAEAMRGGA